MKINNRVTVIAHPGKQIIILVGEDNTSLAMTSETALNLVNELRSMAILAGLKPDPEPAPEIFTLAENARSIH